MWKENSRPSWKGPGGTYSIGVPPPMPGNRSKGDIGIGKGRVTAATDRAPAFRARGGLVRGLRRKRGDPGPNLSDEDGRQDTPALHNSNGGKANATPPPTYEESERENSRFKTATDMANDSVSETSAASPSPNSTSPSKFHSLSEASTAPSTPNSTSTSLKFPFSLTQSAAFRDGELNKSYDFDQEEAENFRALSCVNEDEEVGSEDAHTEKRGNDEEELVGKNETIPSNIVNKDDGDEIHDADSDRREYDKEELVGKNETIPSIIVNKGDGEEMLDADSDRRGYDKEETVSKHETTTSTNINKDEGVESQDTYSDKRGDDNEQLVNNHESSTPTIISGENNMDDFTPLTVFTWVGRKQGVRNIEKSLKVTLKDAKTIFPPGTLHTISEDYDTYQRGGLFPLFHISEDSGTIDQIQESDEQIDPGTMGPQYMLDQGVFEEVARVTPSMAGSSNIELALAVTSYKSMDPSISPKLIKEWKNWTGSRAFTQDLEENGLDCHAVRFFVKKAPAPDPQEDNDYFSYVVINEVVLRTPRDKIALIDCMQRFRVERWFGYQTVYEKHQ
ncbi:unnamed protein product [Meganyctiphanes norvegica]|uniref:DUF7153 domain-containing protein n=1 Tax=Meganyctiphanes norvegica TaxID=48144 RepID=A0AAV2PGX7_MEGNR